MGSDEILEGAEEEILEGVEEVSEAEVSEVVELEISEEDIIRYLEEEDGTTIGFVILEDGEEVEYLFAEDGSIDEDDTTQAVSPDDDLDLGITKDGIDAVTNDANAIFKDGVAVAAEFKGALNDIKSAFDFKSFLK